MELSHDFRIAVEELDRSDPFLNDLLVLCDDIINLKFPRIHTPDGDTLFQIYQRLYPLLSVKDRLKILVVIEIWKKWCQSLHAKL